MSETDCPILPHGKLHERLSDHDIELAELRQYLRSLDRSTEETKRAIKAMQETLAKTNDLLHAAHVKDENLFAHMKHTDERFKDIQGQFQDTNIRIDRIQSSLRNIAISLFLAFAIGLGGMTAEHFFKGM